MNRELALKIVLAIVGVIFVALVYPLAIFMRQEPALSMQFSLYVTLGVFLAAGNPQSVGESQCNRLHRVVQLRSRRSDGHTSIAQHGRTWRTDWCGGSRGDRRSIDCSRANQSKCGVRLSPIKGITLTRGRRTVDVACLLIRRPFFGDHGLIGNSQGIGNHKRPYLS
jgi:hypothetical protein